MLQRPAPDEYAPAFADYVGRVPETDVVAVLERQIEEVQAPFGAVAPERESFRYAAGKWSVREVLGHLIDAERVFGYRALRFARGDQTPLPGFDEDAYAAAAGHDRRPLALLLDEFASLRRSHLHLFRGLEEAAWTRRGTSNGKTVSVRALAYLMAGHVRHHADVLRTRYAVGDGA